MNKNRQLGKKDEGKKSEPSIDRHEWQAAHIEKGVEAAKKENFASDKETADFFKKYGKCS
jgi:predicted transcriptional regulator